MSSMDVVMSLKSSGLSLYISLEKSFKVGLNLCIVVLLKIVLLNGDENSKQLVGCVVVRASSGRKAVHIADSMMCLQCKGSGLSWKC